MTSVTSDPSGTAGVGSGTGAGAAVAAGPGAGACPCAAIPGASGVCLGARATGASRSTGADGEPGRAGALHRRSAAGGVPVRPAPTDPVACHAHWV